MDFLVMFLNKIKEIQYDWIEQIHEIENTAKKLYNYNKEHYFDLFSKMISRIDAKENNSGNAIRIPEWVSIFNKAFSINNIDSSQSYEDFIANFLLIVTQKISQQLDQLIAAIVMINEFQGVPARKNKQKN
jgi:hypothetical protein